MYSRWAGSVAVSVQEVGWVGEVHAWTHTLAHSSTVLFTHAIRRSVPPLAMNPNFLTTVLSQASRIILPALWLLISWNDHGTYTSSIVCKSGFEAIRLAVLVSIEESIWPYSLAIWPLFAPLFFTSYHGETRKSFSEISSIALISDAMYCFCSAVNLSS